jgi:hypothetical protein
MIRKQAHQLIDHELEERFEGGYHSIVEIEYPLFPEGRKYVIYPEEDYDRSLYYDTSVLSRQRRHGFFYYLLVLSTVSLAIIGLLVYGAVAKVYFP